MGGRRNHQCSPPWRSTLLSDAVDGGDDEYGWSTSEGACTATKEQETWHLPIANVGRIMKRSLPASAKISKEAKGAVQECVSEFIGFVTGEASDRCRREKRKTVNGDDLLWAMTTLGFQSYAVPLKAHMDKYREMIIISSSNVIPASEEEIDTSAGATEGSSTRDRSYHTVAAESNSVAGARGVIMSTYDENNSSRQGGGGLPDHREYMSANISEVYGFNMAPVCVGGAGMLVGEYCGRQGQHSEFADFTVSTAVQGGSNSGSRKGAGEANVLATAASAHAHFHGSVVQGFY